MHALIRALRLLMALPSALFLRLATIGVIPTRRHITVSVVAGVLAALRDFFTLVGLRCDS